MNKRVMILSKTLTMRAVYCCVLGIDRQRNGEQKIFDPDVENRESRMEGEEEKKRRREEEKKRRRRSKTKKEKGEKMQVIKAVNQSVPLAIVNPFLGKR